MRERLDRLGGPLAGLPGGLPAPLGGLVARLALLARAALTHRALGPAAALGAIVAALAIAVPLGIGTQSDAFVLEAGDGHPFVVEVEGEGDRWVLLGHMYPTNRGTWDKLSERLRAEGYRTMRWDFRCHGASRCAVSDRKIDDVPDIYHEWNAAIDYAVAEGARELYGLGASFGGTSLMQAAADRPEFTAVGAISSPNMFPNRPPENYRPERLDGLRRVHEITVPKLFIVGARNWCAYLYSDRFFERSVAPSRLVVLESDLHGTTMLDDNEVGPTAVEEIVAFLDNPSAISGKEERNLAPDADPQHECDSGGSS